MDPFPSKLIRGIQIGSVIGILLSLVAVVAVTVTDQHVVNDVSPYLLALLAILASAVTFFVPKQLVERHQVQARLLIETNQRLVQMETLHRISSIVAGPIDLEQALQRILVAVRVARPFDTASLFVLDESTNVLRIVASQDLPSAAVETASFKVGEGIIGWVVANNRPVVLGDCTKDPRYKPAQHGEDKPRSLMAVPLIAGGKVVAALTLSHFTPSAFTPEDQRLVEMIASYASQIIENARLVEEASEARALRRLDVMKTEFLASVSHEFRTPLTVIKGAVEILLELVEADAEPVKRRLLNSISHHQERLSRLVGDLLDLAQLEVGRVQLSRQMTSIEAVVHETASSLDPIAKKHSHSIEIDLPQRLPKVYVDRHRLQQVLTNLLGNAVQHTGEGTSIRISAAENGAYLEISVGDNGPGIPQPVLRHIFDKFSQHRSHGDKPGTGLGLAIAKSLVELHGGTIRAESALGVGSTFTFTLPKEIAEE